jgi:hypothetical protein
MANAKAKAAPAQEEAAEIKVGSWATFLGYPKGTKKEEMVLTKGEAYEVVGEPGEEEVDGKMVETGYILRIPNPDFDSKKKANDETNPEFLETEVFPEEIELAETPADAGGAEEPLTYEELAGYTLAELVEFAKVNEVKLTAAQKKDADQALAVVAAAFELSAPEQEEEQEEKAPVKGAAKAKADTKAKAPTAAEKKAAAAAEKASAKAKPEAKAKPAPKQEDPDEEVDPDAVPELDGEDADVLALIEGAEDLVKVAQDLESEVATNEYRLGGVLYHIKKEKLHLATDKKGKLLDPEYGETGGFKKFLLDNFNLDYRKATYLIDIYINFTQAGIENPAEYVGSIGWTKASKISKYLVADNADVDALLDVAEKNSVSDLSDILKEQFSPEGESGKGGEGDAGPKKTRITLRYRYVEEEANAFEDALKELAEQFGVKPEEALYQVVLDAHAREAAGGGDAQEEEEEAPKRGAAARGGKGRATARA